jgi:hypothetical protein
MKRASTFALPSGSLRAAATSRLAITVACVALAACAGILGLRDRKTPPTFPHRPHVVAGVTCTRCHEGVTLGGAQLHIPGNETCTTSGCHSKPHDPNPCRDCHGSKAVVDGLEAMRQHLVFDHSKHLGEAKGNCMRCHDAVATGIGAMRPPMATCFRCHDDLEKARKCDTCHKDLEEDGTLPQSHLAHEGDWIREHGARAASSGDLCETCHKQSFCAGCHGKTVPTLPANRELTNPFRNTLHRADFAARHALEAKSDPGACQTCHSPERCMDCHVKKGVATFTRNGNNPHPPGWVGLTSSDNQHGREARRDPAQCASCHSGAGEKLCVTCHASGGPGGNPHPPGVSSNLALTEMPCRMCHPIGSRP